jgi:protein O-GlcNAc transferase
MKYILELANYAQSRNKDFQLATLVIIKDLLKESQSNDLLYYAGLLSANVGLFDESIYYYSTLLQSDPQHKQALFDIGAISFHIGKWDESIHYGNTLIEIDNTYNDILIHVANSYSYLGKYKEASELFAKSLNINPSIKTWSDYFLSLNYINLDSGIREYIRNKFMGSIPNYPIPNINPKNKIRIGYVSSDFRNHAVSYFYKGLITKHNSNRFEVYYYYTRPFGEDDITEIYKSSGIFKTIGNSDNLYEIIKNDDIDILIDLNGFTGGNSLDVFIQNPSPIQMTWLGFLNTLSIPSIKYKISDKNLIPSHNQSKYSEQILMLDNSLYYHPPTDSPKISESPYSKNGWITFGYFNSLRKVNDEVLEAWGDILLSHNNSKFIIVGSKYEPLNIKISNYMYKRGFYNLEFKEECSMYDFMKIISETDIALDPFPHVGGATTGHTLWMGVPILTLRGEMEFERISSSLLTILGLDEFVANSKEDYIKIGKEIQIQKIIEFRKSMRERFPEPNINELEDFYINIYEKEIQLNH